MRTLRVNLKEQSYDILIKTGVLSEVFGLINMLYSGKLRDKKLFIITDENVERLHLPKLLSSLKDGGAFAEVMILKPGEASKNLENLSDIFSRLADANITRSDVIIALGGGVIGDIAGFAAACYLRGIDYIQIPTTLLAQVDSSVGGKVAIDIAAGKNLVGAFHQPKMVIIDPDVLLTLDERFVKDGMGEVIKHGLLFSEEFINKLIDKSISPSEMVFENCKFKATVVERDEFDKSERMLLNFGHTLGHAIEKYYGFEKFSHGEAVAIGMMEITKISESKGLSDAAATEKIRKMLEVFGISATLPADIDRKKLVTAIINDKKNLDGALNLVLIKDIGKGFIHKTDIHFFDDFVKGD